MAHIQQYNRQADRQKQTETQQHTKRKN